MPKLIASKPKITMLCYCFPNGYKAYFFKGNPKEHVVVQPGETVSFPSHLIAFVDKWVFRYPKIQYSSWAKRIKGKAKT